MLWLIVLFALATVHAQVPAAAPIAAPVYVPWNNARAPGRALLGAAPQCVWSPKRGCNLNSDFVTSLNGTPVTDSQKFLAKVSTADQVCSGYNTNATCTSKPAEFCAWDTITSSCSVGNGMIDQQWLRGRAYCPNSLADYAVTCSALTSQSSCSSNSNCVWQSTSQVGGSFAGDFLSTVSSWTGSSASGVVPAVGTCSPKWATDKAIVDSLFAKIVSALGEAILGSTSSSGANSFLGPIFNDMYGTCSGVESFKNLTLSCGAPTNKGICEAVAGCGWTPSGTGNVTLNGKCDIASDFGTSLFLNATDPWVKAFDNATSSCAAQLSNVTCAGLATINVDTSKYNSTFANITVSEISFVLSGAASTAGISSLLLSLLAALACLWAFLL